MTARIALALPLILLLIPLASCAASAPATAPSEYEAELHARTQWYLRQIANEDPRDIMKWAHSIKLGDPHKYALPVIVARLSFDPKDQAALEAYRDLMEIDRTEKGESDRGLYHFSAYLRTRLYFMGRKTLPEDVLASNVYDVSHFFRQLRAGGTENQTWMQRVSGVLWSEQFPDIGAQKVSDKEGGELTNAQWTHKWLRDTTRDLYRAGQGEYDSSTYVVFTMSALSNLIDFSENEQTRDTARAAMDWLAASQALKYFHGCNMGPEARGFADSAVTTHTDWMNWILFDDSARPMDLSKPISDVERKTAKHALPPLALSSYRVPLVIRNIATKNIKLPFESRGSKPSYYGAKGNKDQEYLYVSDQFSMTTLYSPEDGVATSGTILPQTTMFKLCAVDKDEVRTFGMTNGYHRHDPLEGRTPYDQYHQHGPAAIDVCLVNKEEDDRTKYRSILGVPLGIAEPLAEGGWYFWQINKAYVAARPLNGKAEFGPVTHVDDKKGLVPVESKTHRYLVSPGKVGGWVMQAGQQPEYPTLDEFKSAVLQKCKVAAELNEEKPEVTFSTLDGTELKLRHTGGPGGRPEAWTNGKALDYANWPVCENPYVQEAQGSGILKLTDGHNSLTIDFSGDWPKFVETSDK